MGMSRAEVRAGIRNAMRQSPYTEHKLVLQEWAATPAGARTIDAIARAAGVDATGVAQLIQRVPAMDFYLAFRQHRLNWRSTADVVVVATLDPDEPEVTGYDTRGEPRAYRRADGVPQGAMLMMHPAERKGLRMNRQPEGGGDVVQDPTDGELSSATMSLEEDPCASPWAIDCPPPGGGGGGGGGTPNGTYMEGFWFTQEADTEWGDEELEFRATLKNSGCGGCTEATHTLRYEGINAGGDYAKYWDKFNAFFPLRITSSSRWMEVRLYETDTFADDSFGERTWMYNDFASSPISGQAFKSWTRVISCPPMSGSYSICETALVSADVRVTPWP